LILLIGFAQRAELADVPEVRDSSVWQVIQNLNKEQMMNDCSSAGILANFC
jgi:hypothetical protein